jgi:hypothetical protein
MIDAFFLVPKLSDCSGSIAERLCGAVGSSVSDGGFQHQYTTIEILAFVWERGAELQACSLFFLGGSVCDTTMRGIRT